jgi:hypothetical protein
VINIFSIPKPFTGQIRTIQYNALSSWTNLDKDIEVILLCNETGIDEAATRFKVTVIKDIDKNSYGTPLLNSAFKSVFDKAKFDILCYVNADILLTPLFLQVLKNIHKHPFLAVVRRMNISVTAEFDFSVPGKYAEIETYANKTGKIGQYWEIDCFAFSKNEILVDLPPFAVGRPVWDLWYIYHALSHKIPVIDMSDSVMVYHQDHDYGHVKNRTGHRWEGPEAEENRKLLNNSSQTLSIANATHVIKNGKVVRALDFFHLRVYIGSLPAFYPRLTGLIHLIRKVKRFLCSGFKTRKRPLQR